MPTLYARKLKFQGIATKNKQEFCCRKFNGQVHLQRKRSEMQSSIVGLCNNKHQDRGYRDSMTILPKCKRP